MGQQLAQLCSSQPLLGLALGLWHGLELSALAIRLARQEVAVREDQPLLGGELAVS